MNKGKEKRSFKIKVPHTYVIIFFIVLIMSAMTWIIQPGTFDYQQVDVGGTMRNLVIPGSYHTIDRSEANPAGIIDFAASFHKGAISAAEVVMLIFLVNGAFHMVIQTGAFNALLGTLLRKFYGKEKILVIILFTMFALCGSLFGMLNEFNGFFPLFVGLGVALGYDAIWGASIVALGSYMGFAGGTMNPYNVVVAQTIAGIPIYSNMGIRIISMIIFCSISIAWILRYGSIIKKDPSKSFMLGEKPSFTLDKESLLKYEITGKHKVVLSTVVIALFIIIWGSVTQEWGTIQLAGVFLLMGIAAAIIDGWNADKIADEFIKGSENVVFGALIIGFARAILVVTQEGKIIDTIIYSLSTTLDGLPEIVAANGMLVMHTIINFFIPSGSGQAATTIPIMAPIGDLLGVSREIVCLTFQFGSSFADLLFPTAGIAIVCGLSGIPLERWWKFYMPLFAIMFVAEVIIISTAVVIGI